MAQNKYAELVSKLLAGETVILHLAGRTETIRTAISKEKKRQEETLKAFELDVENTRLRFKHQINGTYKVFLEKHTVDFEILTDPPGDLDKDE